MHLYITGSSSILVTECPYTLLQLALYLDLNNLSPTSCTKNQFLLVLMMTNTLSHPILHV